MDSQKLQRLLDKYWAGETSLEEEAQLKEAADANPEQFPDQEFVQMHQLSQNTYEALELSSDFDTKLMTKLSTSHAGSKSIWRQFPVRTWYAAAVLLIGLAVGIAGWQIHQEQQKEKEYAAYLKAKHSLEYLASVMNRGMAKVSYLEKFDETTEKVKKEEK